MLQFPSDADNQGVQAAYVDQRNRLVDSIDATKSILSDLRTFNKQEWVIRYPQQRQNTSPGHGRGMRHSISFTGSSPSESDVPPRPPTRSVSLKVTPQISPDDQDEKKEQEAEETEEARDEDDIASDFQVLRLDLKLGPHSSPASLVQQLEKSSIANLIEERITSSLAHIDKLRARIEDTSSKVLVTGDLNAGKSTFVNALLRREVMPVDQQPCTTAFCEVHDAAENDGKEEVHALKSDVQYNIYDETTFTRHAVSELDDIVGDNENPELKLKLYLADTRAPSESLLNNGVVDISLIDAPGLNRDSLKTTAVFARQEEIDVVVFVVSAENHFTLSAKEFLWNASNEKAYLFIVVNKYDQIKNKEKCRRLVLEQIKQLSPRTYEDAEDLVHFVDSANALHPSAANPAFDDLESALRSFVLVKRSKSKLQPVSTYLLNLLSDINLLARANTIVAQGEVQEAQDALNNARPILDKMKKGREALEEGLEAAEDDGAKSAASKAKSLLSTALEKVGQGKVAVEDTVSLPPYPGLLRVWDYARDVRKALLTSLDAAVKLAEDEARVITSRGVDKIRDLGEEHLPAGVERSRRVFMPEAMFSARPKAGRRQSRRYSAIGGAIVAGGLNGLGIGLAQRSDMLETTFFDLFDVRHQLLLHFGDEKQVEEETSLSALGLISVGAGALTMVGGQAMGVKGLITGFIRVTDLVGNETARKWAAPVIGACVIGLSAYFVLELPNSIPRTVGRRVKSSLTRDEEGHHDNEVYVGAHAERISRETRKVLRLASWDLKERFRGAMEERAVEVKKAEDMEKKAHRAVEWFGEIQTRTNETRTKAAVA